MADTELRAIHGADTGDIEDIGGRPRRSDQDSHGRKAKLRRGGAVIDDDEDQDDLDAHLRTPEGRRSKPGRS